MLNKRADKLELLRIAEAVALEKSIDKELIISSMETGIAKAAKSKFGQENEIKVSINRDNGDIEIFRKLIVAENPENSNTEIKLEDAINLNEINKDKAVGDEVLQPLPSFDFGRIAAQTAKQVISFNVREAERERQYNDFIDKKDSILSGIVKRLEFGNVIADLGRTEAIIQKNEMIPRENIKAGDRIKAYCYDVRREPRGQQIFLSRAHPKFMEKLFIQEVPEIYDGLIEIKSSSRDPGSRAKICVKAVDTSLDPVGACVGMRGSRVQAVVNELQGEKIDIVNWSEDIAILVSNALSPAEVQRVNVDSERKKLDVILTEENLSKAIGRRGQNVRLATKLLNYEINIMTDAEDSERRQSEFKEKTENFVKNLELDETLGQLLVAEGFSSIDDIKDTTAENLMKIEGIEEDTAKALIERAKEFHQKDQEDISERIKELGLKDALINLKGLTPGMLMTLGEKKIQTLEIGFKGFLSERIHASVDYYVSLYEDFFSAPTVITPLIIKRQFATDNDGITTDVTSFDNIDVVGILPINYNLSNPPYATQWDGRDNDQDWHYTGRHLYYDNYDSDNDNATPNSYDHPANCQNGCVGDWYHYFGWDGVEEVYEDNNNNNMYDYGEPFTDCDYNSSGILVCEGDSGWDESLGNNAWNCNGCGGEWGYVDWLEDAAGDTLGYTIYRAEDVVNNSAAIASGNIDFGAYQGAVQFWVPVGVDEYSSINGLAEAEMILSPRKDGNNEQITSAGFAYTPLHSILAPMNYGNIWMQGLDIGITYLIPDYKLTLDGNFSFYKTTDYYNELTKKNDPINAPKFKMNASLGWQSPFGDIAIKYRHVDRFEWKDGIWAGWIGPYDLFDLHYNYKINRFLEGNLTIQNLFDERHKEMIGGAVMGRQLIVRLTASI